MSEIRIMTNFNIELGFPAAPFHRRFLAWVIDIIILFIYVRIAIEVLTSMTFSHSDNTVGALALAFAVPLLTYHFLCELFMNGQSLGKKITGIRVVNERGGRPGIGQLLIRWIIRTSDFMILVMMVTFTAGNGGFDEAWKVGIALGLFITDIVLVNASKKNQRLGDMLAHTILIRSSEKHSIHDTIFLDMGENYVPSFPQVMQLSDRDINSLKGILDTARKRGDYNLAEMASDKIKNHLGISSPLSPYDFLEVLLKDYNYLSQN